MKKRLSELEKKYENAHDDRNPLYIFNLTHTELLAGIARGEINAVHLAQIALMNRGRDINGDYIGFDQAEKYWEGKK